MLLGCLNFFRALQWFFAYDKAPLSVTAGGFSMFLVQAGGQADEVLTYISASSGGLLSHPFLPQVPPHSKDGWHVLRCRCNAHGTFQRRLPRQRRCQAELLRAMRYIQQCKCSCICCSMHPRSFPFWVTWHKEFVAQALMPGGRQQ